MTATTLCSATIELLTTDQSIASFLSNLPTKGADQSNIDALRKRASNWKNIFDDKSETIRAKDGTGN